MVRILGNSPERIEIPDLEEVIYYHQIKDFTDQEYENSKDLQREVRKGRLAKIEDIKTRRGSLEVNESPGINKRDLKAALREVLPELKGNGVSKEIKEAVREVAPLIVDMVRQEVSKIAVTGIAPAKTDIRVPFKGPEYIPDISTDGMKESLKPKERTVTADDIAENLAALRELQKKNKNKS